MRLSTLFSRNSPSVLDIRLIRRQEKYKYIRNMLLCGLFASMYPGYQTVLIGNHNLTEAKKDLQIVMSDPMRKAEILEAKSTLQSTEVAFQYSLLCSVIAFSSGLIVGLVWSVSSLNADIETVLPFQDVFEKLKEDLRGRVRAYGDLFSPSFVSENVTEIVKYSTPESLDLTNLALAQRQLVSNWISEKYRSFAGQAKQFSTQFTEFDFERGYLIDEELVHKASRLLLASTRVTEASLDFWRESSAGQDYRAACGDAVRRTGGCKSSTDASLSDWTGVFRVFTIAPFDGRPMDNSSVLRVLEEAELQQSEGIQVKIAISSGHQGIGSSLQDFDVLLVDNQISSVTQQLHNGESRSIRVTWNSAVVADQVTQWHMLWKQSYSPSDFRKRYGINKDTNTSRK